MKKRNKEKHKVTLAEKTTNISKNSFIETSKQYSYKLFTNIILNCYNKVVSEADDKIRVVNIEIPLFDKHENMVFLREKQRSNYFDGSDVFVDIDNIYFVSWRLWSAKCMEEVEKPAVIGIREITNNDELNNLSDSFMISLKDLILICEENEFELVFLEKSVIMYPSDYITFYKEKNIKTKVLK